MSAAVVGTQRLDRDYRLGDIVTGLNAGWDVRIDARVVETTQTWEGSGYSCSIQLGTKIPTLASTLKSKIAGVSAGTAI